MTFIWPLMLGLLLLVPILAIGYVQVQRQRRRLLATYGSLTLVQPRSSGRTALRRHLPAVILLAALVVLIVATARPQATVALPTIEGTIMLAFDVSASMSADDIQPTRLEAAQAAARDFVEKQPSTVKIGVVTFSDAGFSAQAPTSDQGLVVAAINRLKVQSGTSVAHGIEAALKAIDASAGRSGDLSSDEPSSLSQPPANAPSPTPVPKGTYTSAAIIMLTDGENNEQPDPILAAQTAADRGIRIYTLGLGSPEGAILHLDGFTVRSRLDEATLQQIAGMTGGAYYSAQTAQQLDAVYQNLSPQLIMKPQHTEVTALFAGAGIALLLIGGALSLLWLGRIP